MVTNTVFHDYYKGEDVDAADAEAVIKLLGGKYGFSVKAASWGGGNAVLQVLSADGTVFISVHTAFTANTFAMVELPPGEYQVLLTTTDAAYMSLVKIPSAGN